MFARFQVRRALPFVGSILLVVLIVVVINSLWQQRQFWNNCQTLPEGTSTQSWYQGQLVSFGFPSTWQGGNCRVESSQERIQLTSRTSLLWWDNQPLGASSMVITTEDRGDRTLAKTLADIRQELYDGQRSYDTTRVDGLDGLVVIDRPAHSADQTTTVIIDQGERRTVIVWTIRAWTDQQRQQLLGDGAVLPGYLEEILQSMRLSEAS